MKKIAVSSSVLLVIVMAALAAGPAAQGPTTVPRHVTGMQDGRFTFTGPWVGPWNVTGALTGTMTHLGLARMSTSHVTGQDGTISGGTFEITAANGDTIFGAYTATGQWISDDQVLGAAILEIAGGTGRFVSASGTITAAFLETFDDPTFATAKVTWTLDGTVNY